MAKALMVSILLLLSISLQAQQVADTIFNPPVSSLAYLYGPGPVVLIDEAHYNFHTSSGRFKPFSTRITTGWVCGKALITTVFPENTITRKNTCHCQCLACG